MADQQAKVTSIDAIESFRATLILFLSKARPTLEEITGEVNRTRLWLQNEQRNHWEKQLKIRSRDLEQVQSELFSSRLSRIQTPSAAQQMAVHRAQAAVNEAEEKLRVLKRWDRELSNRADPLVKQIEQLHGFVSTDMVRAVSYLTEMIKTLQSYSELSSSPSVRTPAAAPAEATPEPAADATSSETNSPA